MDTAQIVITIAGVNTAGVVALLVGLFRALQSGAIVTRREADGIAADRDMWRDTVTTLTPVVEGVLSRQDTTNHLLRSLPGIPEVDKV